MSKKKTEPLAPDTVVFEYTGDREKVATTGALPGVPLDDLTLDRWNQIPIWQRPSVTAHPNYKKVVDVALEGEEHPKDETAPTADTQPATPDQPAA